MQFGSIDGVEETIFYHIVRYNAICLIGRQRGEHRLGKESFFQGHRL